MRHALIALLAAGSLVVYPGCGNSGTTPTEGAEAAAETLLESCARDEPEAASDVLSDSLQRRFGEAPSAAEACRDVVGLGKRGQPPAELRGLFRGADITRVVVQGGFARARVVPESGAPGTVELQQVRGEWKVGA